MTRKLHLALMAYDGTVPAIQSTLVLCLLQKLIASGGWNVAFSYRTGDSILPRARNAELANFLFDQDATDMVQIDADTTCSADDLIKLLDVPVDVVGAPYRTRNEPLAWPSVRWMHHDLAPDALGLLEVDAVGTGLIRVTRKAAQMLWDAEPRTYLDPTCRPGKAKPVFWYDIAGVVADDPTCGHLWGEDIVFCRKWRDLGGKVFTHTALTTTHIGTHHFTANLAQWLAECPEQLEIDDVTGKKSMVNNGFRGVASSPAPAHLHIPAKAQAA